MDTERVFQVVLLAVAAILTFLLLRPYLTVILGGVLLAYVLSTPYQWLAPRVGERIAAIGLILGTLILFLIPFVLLVNVIVEGVGDLLETLRQNGGLAEFDGLRSLLESVFGIQIESDTSLFDLLQQGEVLELAQTALDTLGGVSNAFVHLTILLFVWYYLLKDGDRLVAWLGHALPLSTRMQEDLFERADEVLYAVVIGNFIVAAIDGFLVAVGLWFVGFSDIVFWLFMCVFMALIPLVGTMLIWVPAAAYLVLVGEVVSGVLLFAYGIVLVGSVDNVVRPFLGAPEIGLEPAIFIVGVLTGLSLFGVLGVFYGPVLLVMTKVLFETVGQDLQTA